MGQMADLWSLDEKGIRRLSDAITCATDGVLKLVQRGVDRELFDLTADPDQFRPLDASSAPAAPATALESALPGAGPPEHGHPADPAQPEAAAGVPEPSADELADLEERMRLLGYM